MCMWGLRSILEITISSPKTEQTEPWTLHVEALVGREQNYVQAATSAGNILYWLCCTVLVPMLQKGQIPPNLYKKETPKLSRDSELYRTNRSKRSLNNVPWRAVDYERIQLKSINWKGFNMGGLSKRRNTLRNLSVNRFSKINRIGKPSNLFM